MDASRLNSCSSRSAAKEEKSDESVDRKEGCTQSQSSKEDELEIAKAKLREAREENARLKMMLEQIENDYKSLQKRFVESPQVEAKNASNPACSTVEDMTEEPDEFVSLRLGSSPSEPKKDDNNSSCGKISTGDDEQLKGGLKLGLDYHLGGSKSDPLVEVSPDNSSEVERKNEDAGEAWSPSKVLKKMRSEEDESSQQPSPKRARVSVRARCDTPTMNDGCQWRKYGQKIAKGNPCPRAYYRCTVAPACPVRKQVQRCAEDMSILITTYEGTHNHPLAVSATAMASTTSAAASMLLSGSSTSQPGLGLTATTTQSTNLHGLKVNFPDISRTGPFYLPNSSPPTFPTITLDLTTSNPAHYNMFSSSSFPSKNFNFSSSETNISPSVWGNGYLNNYGKLPYDKPLVGSSTLGRPAQEHFYQPFMEKNNQAASSQQPLTESLTKALTSDPSFQSVIAAAISSMVGGGGSGSQGGGERFGQNLKWGEAGCASSYLTKSPSSNSQTGSMNALQQPTSSPFSVSKSNSATAKNGDQTK